MFISFYEQKLHKILETPAKVHTFPFFAPAHPIYLQNIGNKYTDYLRDASELVSKCCIRD